MLYYLGFDVAESDLGLGTITLSDGTNPDVVVTYSSVTGTDADSASTSLFWFYDGSGGNYTIVDESPDANTALSKWARSWFGASLRTALRAEATTQSWASPSSIDVAINSTTGIITISYNANISISWSTDAGREFLGYSDTTWSGANSHEGDQTPSMIVSPTLSATSLSTPNYEPDSVASRAYTNDGAGHGIARTTSPLFRDWVQQYETKAKTIRESAATAHPATFQKLFEHCRTKYAFVVDDGGFGDSYNEAFALRSEGASWRPERATPANDSQFHINFQTHVLGKFQSAS